MPDIAGLIDQARLILDLIAPLVGSLLVVTLAMFIYRRIIGEFRESDRAWDRHMDRKAPEYQEKSKNDDHNLALLDQPEKPKRMFVRLGDDGELVEWSDQHETNRQV